MRRGGWLWAGAAVLAACPGTYRGRGGNTTLAEREELRMVPMERVAPPDAGDLLREALAGTVADAGALGARVKARKIRMPHPPRGGNARFDFDGGRRGWITAMPSAELLASPAFAEGRVFLGGGFASHSFYALDAYSGELDWTVEAPDGGPSAAIVLPAERAAASGAPPRDGGKILFNTESCTLFVVDAATGRLLWKRLLGDPLMSQPAAGGGLVFSAYPANGAHEFGAFRLSDGEPVWKIAVPADVIQAPQVEGDSVFFSTMDGTAFRVTRATGRVLWRRDVRATSALWVDRENVLLSRKVSGDQEQPVVLSARDGRLLHASDPVSAPYLGGASRDRQLGAAQAGAWGGVPHGEHLGLANVAAGWAFQGSSPAVADGRAYFAIGGELRARDMATGDEVWRVRYAQADGAQALSPPAVVGSQLVFGTVDGQVYSVDVDTGLTLWAYEIGEPVVFQPVVAQGWVYVATGGGNVVGLEVGDPLLDGWHMWGGNARHAGLVETAGTIDPALLRSLERPSQGTMRALEEGEPKSDLPLARTRVEATVSGFVARVTVTQTFENPSPEPVEAVYLFPLPADAAVDDMEMHVGERVVRARIQKREEARRTYDEARASGRRAALLEQQRPNLFAQRVANLQPGERIEVRIRYVNVLPYEQGRYEFAFPMVAERRYDPANPAAAEPAPEARPARDVDLAVEVDAGLRVERIHSPSHEVEQSRRGETSFGVRLAAADRVPNRDFVLRWAVGGDVPRATVLSHRDETEGFFTLLVQPPDPVADVPIAPRDVTFVVDTSSSMKGRPIDQAKAVVRRVVEGLRPDDTVDVVAFSDRLLRSGRVDAARTISFVQGLRAAGATETVPAIEAALDEPARDGRLRIVVLVTDGLVGNETDVLRTIATRLGATRLFALGVGSSPNRFLLERAAEVGRGRAVVAALSEDPGELAGRFASLVDRPVLTDVAVDFGGLDVSDVYPARIPDLFAGRPLALHGKYGRGGRATVRVRGTLGGRRVERAVDVVLPAEPGEDRHEAQRSLWARAAIHDRTTRMLLRDDPHLVEEVTDLGLRHRIVTEWTSFVAVDEEPARTGGDAEAVEVAQATLSPARALPGDPEIRVPAPRDARAVTVILPFGETVEAAWEPELRVWSARFLIPRDAEEGTHPVEIAVVHADGRVERSTLWYTVDASAPLVRVEALGDARPGAHVTLRATQTVTEADLRQVGWRRDDPRLATPRAQLLSDARRVDVRAPDGTVVELGIAGPGVWEGTWRVPDDARGTLRLEVVVADLAANVRTQPFEIQVRP